MPEKNLPVAHYVDQWTVDPGDRLAVRAEGDGSASIDLVRVRGVPTKVTGHRYDEEPLGISDTVMAAAQPDARGSYALTERSVVMAHHGNWQWSLDLHPTLTDAGTVLDWANGLVTLAVHAGALRVAAAGVAISLPIDGQSWSQVVLGAAAGTLTLAITPVGPDAAYRRARSATAACNTNVIDGVLIIGRGFNGKIGALRLDAGDTMLAAWDFSAAMVRQVVPGTGLQGHNLTLVNAPRRAVTGARWSGAVHDWRQAPDQYDAIHFHDDDVGDCGWSAAAELVLPTDCPSGIYAVRMTAGDDVRYTPLFVRPQRPKRLAFLASTFSYLAYGNSIWASPSAKEIERAYPGEAARMRRSGLSTYSRHRDGSGVGLVSVRRPILNMRPGFLGETQGGQVLINDDLRITQWLDRQGEGYDVVTDHDLHERGNAALAGCDVLVTGAHPEYHSAQSLDALAAFQARGGRLIYMGGNGFYWRVATLPDAPHIMELRRAENGIRMWAEPPGEYHHQADGGRGGLWRHLGRAPNRFVGVGYSAQGDEVTSRPYRRTRAAADPRAAFLFVDVAGDTFGTGNPVAAAGYELDRADKGLGTPAHALVVARSEPFGDALAPVNEERLTHTVLGVDDPLHADLTFFETPAGGAVLSTGSVFYATALAESDGAGRVVANALRRFLDPTPFQLPEAQES